jgi:hypothetical protein
MGFVIKSVLECAPKPLKLQCNRPDQEEASAMQQSRDGMRTEEGGQAEVLNLDIRHTPRGGHDE